MKKANSMAELEQLILNEMQKAMTVVHSKSLKDTENEVQSFYSQGSPSIYKRTGKLGKVLGTMVFLNTEKMFISIFGWIELTVM